VDFSDAWTDLAREAVRAALEAFRGSRRRSEDRGRGGRHPRHGRLYAHHPTAIRTTLEGLKAFYPKRRLGRELHVAHLYLDRRPVGRLRRVLRRGDEVILHKIYASARGEVPGWGDRPDSF
jgi:UDP-N-acetylmuramate--alanine ligase